MKLKRPVAEGQSLTWNDVASDTASHAFQLRREMEHLFTGGARPAAGAPRESANIG